MHLFIPSDPCFLDSAYSLFRYSLALILIFIIFLYFYACALRAVYSLMDVISLFILLDFT